VRANFKLKPREIIETLNLRRPIYRKTAAYGHFGRNDPDFTWEATDKAAKLAADAGLKKRAGREPENKSSRAKEGSLFGSRRQQIRSLALVDNSKRF
jgi:hypothetical protein